MSKVAVFDSFVADLMARSPYLPASGEMVRGSMFKMGPRGKGFNQCVAVHKMGKEVVMMTKAGRDSFANVALDTIADLGTDKEHVSVSDDKEMGTALILVDGNTNQNKIVIVPRACNTIIDKEIKSIENVIKESEYVPLQLEVNQDVNEMMVDMANWYGCKVIVNTAPYSLVTDDSLSRAYMATPNEVEVEELTGTPVLDLQPVKRVVVYFYDKGVQKVLITLGSRGVFVSSDGREEIMPAFRVDVVDTTGAGNAFNGGPLAALAEGKDIWEAVCFASGLVALSVQKLGTTPPVLPREEIGAFLQSTQWQKEEMCYVERNTYRNWVGSVKSIG